MLRVFAEKKIKRKVEKRHTPENYDLNSRGIRSPGNTNNNMVCYTLENIQQSCHRSWWFDTAPFCMGSLHPQDFTVSLAYIAQLPPLSRV